MRIICGNMNIFTFWGQKQGAYYTRLRIIRGKLRQYPGAQLQYIFFHWRKFDSILPSSFGVRSRNRNPPEKLTDRQTDRQTDGPGTNNPSLPRHAAGGGLIICVDWYSMHCYKLEHRGWLINIIKAFRALIGLECARERPRNENAGMGIRQGN